jgi:hypothetical protein
MNPSAAMNMNYTSRVSTESDNRDGAAAFTGYSAGMSRGRIQACAGKRFFVTTKGYMGIANPDACPGDSVVISLGAKTPFVLE